MFVRFCAAVACVVLGSAHAAQPAAYPVKPVRIIVPFAAAGGSDIMARSLAQALTASTGQQFVVENRPGANALIGTEAVAKAAPDGYTLLLTTNIFTINPWLYPNVPFNVERDFAPITLAGSTPNLLAVHPSIPVKTVKELIALAKARPGQLTIAAAGLAPFAKSGRVRALAVSGSKRAASMPEVPTAAETLPGFDVLTWYGLFAPVATPREIIVRLHGE